MFYEQQIENLKKPNKSVYSAKKVVVDQGVRPASEESSIRFHVEKIPSGLNYLDLIKFKKLITGSINGDILRVFTLKDHLVYVYTIDKKKSVDGDLFLSKVDFIKSFIKDKSECEIWVLKDNEYLCIGFLQSAPIFCKSFQSVFEVNEDIHMMVESMRSYGMMSNARFFCCNSNEFNYHGNLNIFEYSEGFMSEIMDGNTSISEYCKEIKKTQAMKMHERFSLAFVSGFILVLCAVVAHSTHKFEEMSREVIERISLASKSGLPQWEHYEQIIEIENRIA